MGFFVNFAATTAAYRGSRSEFYSSSEQRWDGSLYNCIVIVRRVVEINVFLIFYFFFSFFLTLRLFLSCRVFGAGERLYIQKCNPSNFKPKSITNTWLVGDGGGDSQRIPQLSTQCLTLADGENLGPHRYLPPIYYGEHPTIPCE